jgi:hypothetical protein
MTSTTRILSAQHVIQSSSELEAEFNQNYAWGENENEISEEWTLSKRLFSLGLQKLARTDLDDVEGIRLDFRKWKYGSNKSFYQHNSSADRDMELITPKEAKIIDAEILRYYSSSCAECSGPNKWCDPELNQCFETTFLHRQFVPGPGPFFNIFAGDANVDHLTNPSVYAAGNQPLPSNYFPVPLFATMLYEQVTGSWSYDALFGESVDCTDSMVCAYDVTSDSVIRNTSNYQHCVTTSLDAVPGWSGGPAFGEIAVQDEGDVMRSWGTLHAISRVIPNDTDANWYNSGVVTPNVKPNDIFYTSVSLLGPNVVGESRRDYDYNLDTTEDHEGVLDQLSEYPDGFYQPGNSVPSGCDLGVFCNNVDPTPGESVGLGSRTDVVESACRDAYAPLAQGGARVANGYMVGWIGAATNSPLQYSGIGDDRDINDTLGPLFGVCAPWSSESYLFNWSALRFMGPPRGKNTVLYTPFEYDHGRFGSNLAHALPSMFEVSKREWLSSFDFLNSEGTTNTTVGEPFDLLRPPSMQMCPPGSALKGVQVSVRHCEASDDCPEFDPSPNGCVLIDGESCGSDGSFICLDGVCQQPIVKGIYRLHCVDLTTSPDYNQWFEVPTLTTLSFGEFRYRHGRSEAYMSLDNFIGNTYETRLDQHYMDLGCDDAGTLVGGFVVDSSTNRIVTGLGLTCIEGPQ